MIRNDSEDCCYYCLFIFCLGRKWKNKWKAGISWAEIVVLSSSEWMKI